jgi:hypothetical protein
MPTFTIPLPDGTTETVEVPEGATREDAAAYLMSLRKPPVTTHTFQMPDGSMMTVEVPSNASSEDARQFALEQFARAQQADTRMTSRGTRGDPAEARVIPGRSILQGAMDPVNAGAQMLEQALPETAVERINQLNNWLADQGLPLARIDDRGLQGQLQDQEAAYQASRPDPAEMDVGRGIGNIATMAAGGSALAPARAASVGGRIAQGVAGGALGGSLAAPVLEGGPDTFWQDKGVQAGVGAAAGGVAGGVLEGVAGMGRQMTRPSVQTVREMGVTPTIGQTAGGVIDDIEQKMTSVPIAGKFIDDQRQRAVGEFNVGVVNDALAPLGAAVSRTGREAVDEANKLVNDAYAYSRSLVDKIDVDQQGAQQMMAIGAEMRAAPEDMARAFDRYVQERIMPRGQGGSFEPLDFKRIDSELGQRVANSSAELRDAYASLRQTLRDMAARQSPEYAEAQARADAAFSRMVRVNKAMNKSATTDTFTPGQLAMAAREADRSAGRRASAGGQALSQDLADAGQDVLGKTVPNSGSVDRASQMMLGGGAFGVGTGVIDPITASGAIGGLSALYTTPMQRMLFELSQKTGVPLGRLQAGMGLGAGVGASTGAFNER